MLSGGIALQDAVPFKWPDDALTLIRALRQVLTELNSQYVLGMPADRILHLVVAGIVFLVVSRWAGRKWAFLVSLFLIVIKEVVDIPRNVGSPHRPYPVADAIGDVLSGLLGVVAAHLIVSWRGDRWRKHGLGESARPLPQPIAFEFSGWAAKTFAAASLVVIVAAGVALELGSWFNWVHLAGAALVCVAAWRFGVGWTLVAVLPLVPFVNWLDWVMKGPAGQPMHAHPLASSDPMILVLGVFAAATPLLPRRDAPDGQALPPAQSRTSLTVPDLLILAFSAFSILTVAISCLQNEPSTLRVRWVVAAFDVAIVYLVASRTFTRRHLICSVTGVAVGLIIMSGMGILEFLTKPLQLQIIPKATYPDAEWFSMYLVMAVPFMAGFALLGRSSVRWLAGAAAVLGLVCVGLVFSRSCWVGVGIALPLLVVIWAARLDRFLGFAAVCALALTLFLGYETLKTVRTQPRLSPFLSEVTSIVQPGALTATRGRTLSTSRAKISEHPLVGFPGVWVGNYYLNLAVTYGVPLAVVLLLAAIWLFGSGAVMGWLVRDRDLFAVLAAALAGIIGAALEGVAESGCSRAQFIPLFWFLLAAIPAAMTVEPSREPVPPEPGRAPALARIHADVSEPRRYVFLFIFFVCVAVVCVAVYYMLR